MPRPQSVKLMQGSNSGQGCVSTTRVGTGTHSSLGRLFEGSLLEEEGLLLVPHVRPGLLAGQAGCQVRHKDHRDLHRYQGSDRALSR